MQLGNFEHLQSTSRVELLRFWHQIRKKSAGWVEGLKAILRIAYSNQKRHFYEKRGGQKISEFCVTSFMNSPLTTPVLIKLFFFFCDEASVKARADDVDAEASQDNSRYDYIFTHFHNFDDNNNNNNKDDKEPIQLIHNINNKDNNIDIAYSQNSSINSIDKVNLQSHYSEVDFQKVNSINIEGNYNTLNFQNVGTLNLSSNYTKVNSKTIQKFAVDGNYLTLKLGEIGSSFIANSNYSDIQMTASNKTDAITINGNYTNSKITCTSDYAFDINVNLKYGSFTDNVGLKYILKSEKNTSKSYTAYHISQGKSKISITTNYGSVQLLNK